ncbi:MAG: PAS domain-containing protein [Spirochaetaceae bacterium]|nr:PAS domain-containing protein [Spirochaetaceae bacterium]
MLVLLLWPAAPAARAEAPPFSLVSKHVAAMLLLDPETGRVVDANDAAVAFYGYPRPKLLGLSTADINALDPAEVAAERQRALAEHRSYFVFPHRLADGSVRTVEVYSSPVTAPDGRRLLLSIIHDMTGRTVLPEDQAVYQARLAALAEDRARQLARARTGVIGAAAGVLALALIAAAAGLYALAVKRREREAAAALEERVELFRELQHRVKNSLTLVRAFVSIEAGKAQGGEAATILEALGGRIDTLATLYRLLHEGSLSGAIELGAYFSGIVDLVMDSCASACSNTPVETDFAPVMVDATRAQALGLALNELLTNACKHGAKGGAEGWVRVSLAAAVDGYELSVANGGEGLPAGFDPEATTGFGLVMARDLARQLGGRLQFRREPATCFAIYFPR